MTVGYQIAGGTDLDSVFKARTSAAAAAVGFKDSGGVDLSQRYEPRGTSTARANVNYKNSAGTDLSQIFMDINAATGTQIATISMTAAANTGGSPNQKGFQRYTTGLADFGFVDTQNVDGATYLLENMATRQDGTGNIFGLSAAGASNFPADADTTWQRVEISGTFSDGAAVRTLTRSSMTVASSNAESGRAYRYWTTAAQPMPFIAGNIYGIKIFKS